MTKSNMKSLNNKETKIILDLCGGTGSWSKPYQNNPEYKVFVLTLPDYDVTKPQEFPSEVLQAINDGTVYGILAAPPCTMFSDARTNAKTPRDLEGGMKIVLACLNIIYACQYKTKSDQQKYSPLKFWALENPWYGRLKWFLGNPIFTFSPWEFGDAYKKKTAIWGYFNQPIKTHTSENEVLTPEQIEKHKTNSQQLPKFDYMASKDIHPEMFGKLTRQARRSITPQGFALSFYKANL
jgi:hypothetical protein